MPVDILLLTHTYMYTIYTRVFTSVKPRDYREYLVNESRYVLQVNEKNENCGRGYRDCIKGYGGKTKNEL